MPAARRGVTGRWDAVGESGKETVLETRRDASDVKQLEKRRDAMWAVRECNESLAMQWLEWMEIEEREEEREREKQYAPRMLET